MKDVGGSVLAVIPARGGSKGLPGKNIRPFVGLPLIAHSILYARMCPEIDRVVVSTDSGEIATVARAYGAEVPFMRPSALAADDTAMWPVLRHALDGVERHNGVRYDYLLLLDPTAPVRLPEDVAGAYERLRAVPSADGIVGVSQPESNPIWHGVVERDGWMTDLIAGGGDYVRRQDVPAVYRINASLYLWRAKFVRTQVDGWRRHGRFLLYETPEFRAVHIDDLHSFERAELLVTSGLVSLPWLAHAGDGGRRARPPGRRSEEARTRPVRIADRMVGPGHPCFVIAEAGVNHNGDADRARQLADVAVESRADAVKYQTFTAERLVTPTAPKARYQRELTGGDESQFEMLRRLELPAAAFRTLKEHCDRRGIVFLSTPFDEESADLLAPLDVAAFKIPSGEITNLAFLAHVARKRKPMIVSTGMSTLAEVEEAVRAITDAGNREIVVLHCVSDYPAQPADANLRAMRALAEALDVPVGFSDHTLGLEVALAAVALGACVLEKHFTLDRTLPGPDHRASLEPGELAALVRGVRTVETALGHGRKEPTAREADTAAVARKSVVAACDIAAGTALTDDLVAIRRPGTGLPPRMRPLVLGRKAMRDIAAGTPLTEEMLS